MTAALDVTRDGAAYVTAVRSICAHAGLQHLAGRYIAGNLSPDVVMLRLSDRFDELLQRPVPIVFETEIQFP